MFVLGEFKLTP